MTARPPAVQCSTSDTGLIAIVASGLQEMWTRGQSHYFDRPLIEVSIEGALAVAVAASIYFGHVLLMTAATLWFLGIVGVSIFRVMKAKGQETPEEASLNYEQGQQGSNTDLAELQSPWCSNL